jgi:hypothetical protein
MRDQLSPASAAGREGISARADVVADASIETEHAVRTLAVTGGQSENESDPVVPLIDAGA